MVLELLMVGEARAEGAWVLWEKDSRLVPVGWVIIGAYDSKDSCVFNETFACKEKQEAYRGACISEVGGHRMVGPTGTWYWMCLPESVDPRKVGNICGRNTLHFVLFAKRRCHS